MRVTLNSCPGKEYLSEGEWERGEAQAQPNTKGGEEASGNTHFPIPLSPDYHKHLNPGEVLPCNSARQSRKSQSDPSQGQHRNLGAISLLGPSSTAVGRPSNPTDMLPRGGQVRPTGQISKHPEVPPQSPWRRGQTSWITPSRPVITSCIQSMDTTSIAMVERTLWEGSPTIPYGSGGDNALATSCQGSTMPQRISLDGGSLAS